MSVEAREPVRSARRDATRERVLDAAREVFAERGVFGATVEEICDRAGFTRGAFYSNFADKDDVLEALIEREHARLVAYLDAHLDLVVGEPAPSGAGWAGGQGGLDGPEAAGLLGAMVERILASVPGDRLLSLVQTELEIHAIRQPAASRAFLDADARFRARISTFIERGIALLGRELTVDAGTVADAAVGVVERSVRRALISGGDDPDAMAREVLPALILAVSRPATAD
ncbi:MAG: TetR/AcrR family transcriptional regulator [Chloroflexi bacterium]|nr:TetR/AcrR family transcriptional regulator [Chloroflexota bacterium]